MKNIFSLAKIVINIRRCHWQTNYFLKVDICEQKLFKVGCKYLFNLIKFIEMDEDLKEKVKIKFEGDFDKDEIIKLWKYKQ